MNRRKLNPRLRIQFLALLFLLGCGALGCRLWWVQVARGADWTARIRGSSEATVRIPSVRGEIQDRNGLTLVGNRASYEVDFYLPAILAGYQGKTIVSCSFEAYFPISFAKLIQSNRTFGPRKARVGAPTL